MFVLVHKKIQDKQNFYRIRTLGDIYGDKTTKNN